MPDEDTDIEGSVLEGKKVTNLSVWFYVTWLFTIESKYDSGSFYTDFWSDQICDHTDMEKKLICFMNSEKHKSDSPQPGNVNTTHVL